MSKGQRWSLMIGAVCAALVLGATVAVTTPAGAQLATNWNQIFAKQIKPRADKVYYKKSLADKKFAPKPKVIRGTYSLGSSNATPLGNASVAEISFGFTLSEAPKDHYIALGDPVPAGCSGTVAAPNAAKGQLCVFEGASINAGLPFISHPEGGLGATSFGAVVAAFATSPGDFLVNGSWAVRPKGFSNSVPVGRPTRQGGKLFHR
jgi:hypothetical protein